MKILMMGHKVIPSRDGGIEVVVTNLATELVKQGHEVTVFNRKRKHDKNHKPLKEYNGVKLEEVFTINKKSLDALVYSFFCFLKIRFSRKKYDVIHIHAEGPCFFLWMLGKHKNTKVVVTIHGLDHLRSKWSKIGSHILRKAERSAVKHADEIIVLTQVEKSYFKNRYNRDTILIPNGVKKATLIKPDIILNKYNLHKDDYILFLGRIVPEKGVHYLLEAWKRVKEQINTDKKLVIAGSESHSQEYYDKIVKTSKEMDSVILTGFVEGQELQELYSNAYLYVLPSDIEGMAMSLLEAMSYGNTCLVSNIPENLEVIDEGCFVFEAGNVDRLRHQIKKIINLNLKTHENIKLPYNFEEVTKMTEEVYKK